MPECFADTLMIQTLVPPVTSYNHKHSCTEVENSMKSGKFKDRFAVGIIDDDTRKIKYLNDFEIIDKVDNSLVLYRHKSLNPKSNKSGTVVHHYIILLQPALEEWILKICSEENIIVEGMPNQLRELKKLTKTQASLDNKILKSVFVKMKEKKENESIKKIKHWLTLLIKDNYNVDKNALTIVD